MKRTQSILAAAAMFFLIIAVLLTGFQIGIYGDPEYGYYRKLYEKYEVTKDLGMEIGDVMKVTDYMMDYLIGREEELSIVTEVDGKEQDFFNEQDRLHMADVRGLFLGGLKLRTALLIAAALIIAGLVFVKADIRRLLTRAYLQALGVFTALLVLLGIGFASDFTACFTLFHKIFFTNDLWLFDPATDYMIRMLPEGFFFDIALRIGGYFILGLILLGVLFFVWGRLAGKHPGKAPGTRGGEAL